MKKISLILSLLLLVGFHQDANAQFFKKLKRSVQKSVEDKVSKKIEDSVDNEVDKVLDGEQEKEESTKKKKSGKSKTNDKSSDTYSEKDSGSVSKRNNPTKKQEVKEVELYRKYKYIPGEQVILFDDLKFEETGEFPSRWDLAKGGVEVAILNGDKVIIPTTEYENVITPLFDKKDYLGDEFTIDFDIYLDQLEGINEWTKVEVGFIEDTNKRYIGNHGSIDIDFRTKKVDGYVKDGTFFDFEKIDFKLQDWNHVSISYHKGKLKVYVNETRVSNLPNFKNFSPNLYISVEKPHSSEKPNMKTGLKNIRIAHGGGQMYKRIMADGKYVTNGILFDSGKAVIKPQSYGIINKMAKILKEQPDWKFEIIGHTDSDGNDSSNLKLSKERAEAVKNAIVTYGISADRLSTVGKGESQPLNTNSTTEEKANNRRVEFIKK